MLASKTIRITPALFLTTLILSACGGGSSGEDTSTSQPTDNSDNNPSTSVSTAGVSITTSNAKTVSSAVLDSVDTVLSASSGVDILFGVSVQPSESNFNYADFIVRQLKNILAQNRLTGSTLTGVDVSDTVPCEAGDYALTGAIDTENTLTEGDALTLSFNNCLDLGVTVSGTMSITIAQVSAGFDFTPPYSFGFNVELSDLSVNETSQVVTGNGDIYMVLSEDGSGGATKQLSGTSLSASWGESQREILTDYDYVITLNGDTGAYGLKMAGTLASDKIKGAVSFTTDADLTSNENQSSGNPTAGQLHITTSADSTQAWLIAQPDGVNVQIDVDTDGDNVGDNTVMSTWTELQSL